MPHSRSDAAGAGPLLGGVNTGIGAWLRAGGAGGFVFLGLCLTAPASSAAPDAPRTEYFTGFELSDNYVSGYVGAGYAFGKAGLYEQGWRLRAVGAYGRYHYDGTLLADGVYVPTTFDGQNPFAAALVGYQFRPGRLIVKLFAGIEAEDQHIVPHDPNNSVQGSALGLRLQAESWLDVSERVFISADATYGTAFQEYWALTSTRLSPGRAAFAWARRRRGRQRGVRCRTGGRVRARVLSRHRGHALQRLHRQLSGGRPELLFCAWALPTVLGSRVGFTKVHCRPRSGSAWPVQLPTLTVEPQTGSPRRRRLFGCASCVRGMSRDVAPE